MCHTRCSKSKANQEKALQNDSFQMTSCVINNKNDTLHDKLLDQLIRRNATIVGNNFYEHLVVLPCWKP